MMAKPSLEESDTIGHSNDKKVTPPVTPTRPTASFIHGDSPFPQNSTATPSTPPRFTSSQFLTHSSSSPLRSRAQLVANSQGSSDLHPLSLNPVLENDDSSIASNYSVQPLPSSHHNLTASRINPSFQQVVNPSQSTRPPSFAESQFATIIRRQRKRRIVSPALAVNTSAAQDLEANSNRQPSNSDNSSVQDPFYVENAKGCHLNVSDPSTIQTDRGEPMMNGHPSWEFAGWGSISMIEITAADLKPPDRNQASSQPTKPSIQLGQWKASAIAGNAVTGSVFYAIPAVVAVSSVLSPISILIACLLLYPFRPILCELTSALSASNAANYSYFSNITSKSISLLAAAITMLDAIATGALSAATASAYIAGETYQSPHALDEKTIAVLLLLGLALICLSGLRESSTVALIMFSLHIGTMAALVIAGCVSWSRIGNTVLTSNWHTGIQSLTAPLSGKGIARSLFDGVCVAFVGLTGVECTPSYVSQVRPGQFSKALRNLHLIVILLEAPLMLLVLVNLPLKDILGGANVLALLGQVAGNGRWLKMVVVVDACLVLCGGIITGIVAFGGLVNSLCDDVVLPNFLKTTMPKTGAAYYSIALFLALALLISVTCDFSLSTLSSIFSVSFLCVMTMFGIALVMLKFYRPSLPRSPVANLVVVVAGIGVGLVSMAGNFALSPIIIVQTLVYFVVLTAVLLLLAKRVQFARTLVWLIQQNHWLRRWRFTSGLDKSLIRWIRKQKRAPVIYFAKTDDISILANALYYIKQNEQTSNCKIVHCYKSIDDIPNQLDDTFQLVDEIFPTITVDLVFVEAPFTPQVVDAVTRRLNVPKSRAFISCPSGQGHTIGNSHALAEYGGIRIILA